MKVVIDTNIFISYLLGKLLSNLVPFILKNQIKVVTSKEQIAELLDVVNKPKLKKYINKSDLFNLYKYITNYSEFVELDHSIEICRDPKDNYLLEIALKGKSNFLVTGDKDLLELNKFHEINIITYRQFENLSNKSF